MTISATYSRRCDQQHRLGRKTFTQPQTKLVGHKSHGNGFIDISSKN